MNNIILMKPIYKDYLWGGTKLKEELKKDTPYERTAESWEISANDNGDCSIINDEYKGQTLKDLFDDVTLKKDIFGVKCQNMKKFPLLIKFIDAKQDLSLQVHPDDNYAKNVGELNGKNEMWYIMDCKQNAKIVVGLNKKLGKQELKECIENNKIKNYLNEIQVKKGDSVYIKAGTLHAILKDNLICEVQQNCDITYRVYDWDRVDENGKTRPLHKKEALEIINLDTNPIIQNTDNRRTIQNLVKNEYFIVDKINCKTTYKDISSKNTFYAISVVKGNGFIKIKEKMIDIKMGDSFIIPATLGEYCIAGNVELLKCYIN